MVAVKRAVLATCPRCLGPVPNAEYQGRFSGALSRVAPVEICEDCGMDEGMAALLTGGAVNGLVPVAAWPLDREAIVERLAPLRAAVGKGEE